MTLIDSTGIVATSERLSCSTSRSVKRIRNRGANTLPASHIRVWRTNSDRGGSFADFPLVDIVYSDDPFIGNEDARPWLILSNHEGRPFHGEQYIAVTLTTKS